MIEDTRKVHIKVDFMIRRNRFEIVGQSLVFAAGVIIALVFVSIMIMEFENSKKLSDAVNENMLELAASIKDNGVMMYDGVRVTGADVLNFGKRYFYSSDRERPFVLRIIPAEGYEIDVDTKSGMEAVVRASGLREGPCYVDPTEEYLGSVIQNENGMITHVTFTYV